MKENKNKAKNSNRNNTKNTKTTRNSNSSNKTNKSNKDIKKELATDRTMHKRFIIDGIEKGALK